MDSTLKNKKIVIAGGTGFIGQALAKYFGKDNKLVIISRLSVNSHNNNQQQQLLLPADGYNITYRRWDGQHLEKHWTSELEGADIVINLAGKSVNCRYTAKNKRLILESRVNATNVLGTAITQCVVPPKMWINAGSATIYRHAMDAPQDEYTGEIEDDFSVQVCKEWEAAFNAQRTPFTRKLLLRMAITLGDGAVMDAYYRLLKFGLGGRQGTGQQMYSWIHITDMARIIEWMFVHKEMEGTYNCAAPHPVTNHYFMQTLRRLTGNSIGLPAGSRLIKLGAWLIGTEAELLLKSRWVLPRKLIDSGFTFRYPHVEEALAEIIQAAHWKKYRLFKPRTTEQYRQPDGRQPLAE
ncbi:MAG TPA: TIGR01777 family oxidoreductase [Chitinophagaceae bacterium]|nr:TIGR01777 family oxidoreductase [Chitinophagaceae bacterium]